MFSSADDCSACSAPLYSRSISSVPISTLTLNSTPFVLTFCLVSALVRYRLFPYLAGPQHPASEHYLPSTAPTSLRAVHAKHAGPDSRRQVAAVAFAATIGLATVLMQLILCEISGTLNPAARALALQITVPSLLFLLIVFIPFLELQSFVRSLVGDFGTVNGGRRRSPWLVQILGFTGWLMAFWWVGRLLPGTHLMSTKLSKYNMQGLSEGCLERIGVIGICLLALLAGFAAVSSPWYCFGARSRPVTEADISRKQAGMDAASDMLGAKRSRLRALQAKLSSTPKEGFMKKTFSAIRGDGDTMELKNLHLEISGLESMSDSLAAQMSALQTRHAATVRASTTFGKFLIVPNVIFSLYCIYRIAMTAFTTLRRFTQPSLTFATTDPVNRFLSLFAKHWDQDLDQAAWSQQISFALTGVMLLLSFNSVLQTFHLLTRWTPGLLNQARQNSALIVAQIAATYVISSALLLRSNLPKDVGTVISAALGTPLDSWFVDRWFEGWFLIGVVLTAVGIWSGRKFSDADEWDDGDVEMGHKRS